MDFDTADELFENVKKLFEEWQRLEQRVITYEAELNKAKLQRDDLRQKLSSCIGNTHENDTTAKTVLLPHPIDEKPAPVIRGFKPQTQRIIDAIRSRNGKASLNTIIDDLRANGYTIERTSVRHTLKYLRRDRNIICRNSTDKTYELVGTYSIGFVPTYTIPISQLTLTDDISAIHDVVPRIIQALKIREMRRLELVNHIFRVNDDRAKEAYEKVALAIEQLRRKNLITRGRKYGYWKLTQQGE